MFLDGEDIDGNVRKYFEGSDSYPIQTLADFKKAIIYELKLQIGPQHLAVYASKSAYGEEGKGVKLTEADFISGAGLNMNHRLYVVITKQESSAVIRLIEQKGTFFLFLFVWPLFNLVKI